MAQRILKCIICGGPHSIFHCVNKCVVCNGDKRDLQGGSVKELEVACRKRLRRHLPVMANMRREGKLLPLKFDERFYQ